MYIFYYLKYYRPAFNTVNEIQGEAGKSGGNPYRTVHIRGQLVSIRKRSSFYLLSSRLGRRITAFKRLHSRERFVLTSTMKCVCMYAHKGLSSQMSEINVLVSNKCSSTLVVGTTSGCSQTLYPKQEGGGVKIN